MRPNNQNQNKNRGRNRGANNRRGGGNNHRSTYDSNGPNVRIRGSASQIYDKYSTLARDAASSGDPVLAESYLQYAEHYYRIANPEGESRPPRRHEQHGTGSDDAAGQMAGQASGQDDEQETHGRGRVGGRGRGRDAQEAESDLDNANDAEEEAVVETITPASAASAHDDASEEEERAPMRRPRTRASQVKTFEQGDLLSEEEKAEAAEEGVEDAKPAPAAKKAPARRRRTPRAKAPQSPAELAAAVSGED